MTTDQHLSMHHFASHDDYQAFIAELAMSEAESIDELGAYEIATDVVAHVNDRTAEIQVGGGSAPKVNDINAPLCPITVLEYSNSASGLPRDEVESISHLAAELLEQDLERKIESQRGEVD